MLEPRTLLSATVLSGETQQASAASIRRLLWSFGRGRPIVLRQWQRGRRRANPVTGKTAQLSVLAQMTAEKAISNTLGQRRRLPNGAQAPSFSANGTNAAKNTTVTFKAAGVYTFKATIIDAGKLYRHKQRQCDGESNSIEHHGASVHHEHTCGWNPTVYRDRL